MIKILIVDDESGIRSLLSEILSEEGFLVYEAPDAAHARQMLAKETFNLILLDIWMPDTDGITLLKEWVGRNLLRTTSVVVMSGHGTIETAMEAVKLGAKDFLEKPISMKRLLETVHGVIQEWIATHAQPTPHKPTPAINPAVKPRHAPAGETSVRPVAAAPSHPRHAAVRDFTINGKKVPARSDKKLRQLFNNFRRSLNEDLTRSRSPEDLYGEITERRKETRGGPNYILKMLAGLLRDIVCTHPEYESADWMLSSANRALKRRYFSRFLSIMRGRMKSRQIGLPHGRYHDQAIRTKADGSPSGMPSEPELALQRSLEFLSNINRIDSPLPGVKDITVLPEPVYNAESERDYAEVRDVKDDDRKDDELFDTKDQFCVDFSERFCPTPLAFPELNPKSLHRQLRDAVAMTVLPKMPLVYVRAYNLLLDYNMTARKVRDQVERSYFLTHLLQANLRVVEAARTVGVERTHLYRKLKRHGIVPKELNQEANGRIRELREERAKAEKERREQERAAARNNKKSGGAGRNARSRKTAGNKKS